MASFTDLSLEDNCIFFTFGGNKFKAKSYEDVSKIFSMLGINSDSNLRNFRIAFKAYLRKTFPNLKNITSFVNEPNRWLRIEGTNLHPTDSFQAIKSHILSLGGTNVAAPKLVESVSWSPRGDLEVKFKGLSPVTFKSLLELNRYIAENFTPGAAMTICEQGAQQFSELMANSYSSVSHVTGMGEVVLKDGSTRALRPDTAFNVLLNDLNIIQRSSSQAQQPKSKFAPEASIKKNNNSFKFENKEREAASMAQQEMDLASLIQSLLGVPQQETAPPIPTVAETPAAPETVPVPEVPANPLVAALGALGMSEKEVKKLLKKKEDKDKAERRSMELKNLTEREKELKNASLELRKEKKALAQPLMTKQQMGVMGIVMFLIAFVTQMGAHMMRNKNKQKEQEVEEDYYHESRRQYAMPAEGQTCSPQNRPRAASKEKPRVKVAQKVKEAVRVSH